MSDDSREFSLNPEDLASVARMRASRRSRTCAARSATKPTTRVKDSLAESSSYFRATVWVTIGTTQFTLYSLARPRGGGSVRPALRSFGSD